MPSDPAPSQPAPSGPAPSDRWTAGLTIGLLAVQTVLLVVLLFRVNALQRLLVGGPGPGAAPPAAVSEEVIDVDPGDGPARGAPEAPVTVVEFSCFTCPSCADLQPALERLLAEHSGEVRLAFRYFPLSLEGKPFLLARAAECGRRQGRFWPVHDLLFAVGREVEGEDELLAGLDGLGLEPAAFRDCLAAPEVAERVRADFEAGRSYGVRATPTLFVNGRKVVGASLAALERAVAMSL